MRDEVKSECIFGGLGGFRPFEENSVSLTYTHTHLEAGIIENKISHTVHQTTNGLIQNVPKGFVLFQGVKYEDEYQNLMESCLGVHITARPLQP